MSLELKICVDCGNEKKIGGSKKRCKACRRKNAQNQPKPFSKKYKSTKRDVKEAADKILGRYPELRNCPYSVERHLEEMSDIEFYCGSANVQNVKSKVTERVWRLFPNFDPPRKLKYQPTKQPQSQKQEKRKKQKRKENTNNGYSDYLKQKLWTEQIRPRILVRDNNKCQVCGCENNLQVHHRSYSDEVMAGKDDNQLITLCGRHHVEIEFLEFRGKNDPKNKKRPRRDVDPYLQELLRTAMTEKIQLEKGIHHGGYIQSCENIDVKRIGEDEFEFKVIIYEEYPTKVAGYYKPFVINPETDLSGLSVDEADELYNQMYYEGECDDDYRRYAKFSQTRKHLGRYAGHYHP